MACLERIGMEISNNLLAVLVIIAVAMSITGTASLISMVPTAEPQEPITTGMASLVATGTVQANLAAEVHIVLIAGHQIVDFESMSVGEYKDTLACVPCSFVIENNGSIEANISMGITGNSLWSNAFNDGNLTFNASQNYSAMVDQVDFMWLLADNSTTVSNISADEKHFVYNLTSSDGRDRIDVHLYATVPTGEPSGAKSTLVRFNASEG